MRLATLLLCVLLGASCAVGRSSEPYVLSDGSRAVTITCEDGWAQCYLTAERLCGSAGYEELDRASNASLSTAGRVEPRVFTGHGLGNEVYREDVRNNVESGTITIRCGRP